MKILTILTFVFLAVELRASSLLTLLKPAPFRFSYSYTPQSKVEANDFSASIKLKQNEINLEGVFGKIDHTENSFLILGIRNHIEHFQMSGEVPTVMKKEMFLYQTDIPMTYISVSDKWMQILRVAPGIYTDYRNVVDTDDLDAAISYMATYNNDKKLKWILGIGHNRYLGDSITFPLLGFKYQPSESILIGAVLPYIYASYAYDHQNLLQFSLTPSGNKWNVNRDVDGVTNKSFDVSYRSLKAGVSYERMNEKLLSLRMEIGRMLFREFRYLHTKSSRSFISIENSNYFDLSLNKRF